MGLIPHATGGGVGGRPARWGTWTLRWVLAGLESSWAGWRMFGGRMCMSGWGLRGLSIRGGWKKSSNFNLICCCPPIMILFMICIFVLRKYTLLYPIVLQVSFRACSRVWLLCLFWDAWFLWTFSRLPDVRTFQDNLRHES